MVSNQLNVKFQIFLVRLLVSLIIGGGFLLLLLRHLYHVPVQYDDFWMDSPKTNDPSLQDASYLLSNLVMPTDEQLNQPVCVLVHGFSASTFEFDYFKSAIHALDSNIQFSTVLMGGHGRDYNSFKSATYSDWQTPVVVELNNLIDKGYKNISILGVSTGATVILNLMLDGMIDTTKIKQVIFIDPFLSPQNKLLFLTPYLQYIVSNTRSGATRENEFRHWHVNRPATALTQLVRLINLVREKMQLKADQINVPISVFSAIGDPVGDTDLTISFLKAHLSQLNVVLNSSSHHAIIEPTSKLDWTDDDQEILDDITQKILDLIKTDSLKKHD